MASDRELIMRVWGKAPMGSRGKALVGSLGNFYK